MVTKGFAHDLTTTTTTIDRGLDVTAQGHNVTHDAAVQFGTGTVLAITGIKAQEHGFDLAAVTAFLAAAGVFFSGLATLIRQAAEVWRAQVKASSPVATSDLSPSSVIEPPKT